MFFYVVSITLKVNNYMFTGSSECSYIYIFISTKTWWGFLILKFDVRSPKSEV